MSKHHHQSKEEQIYKKVHGAAPFHHVKTTHQASKSIELGHNQTKVAVSEDQDDLK